MQLKALEIARWAHGGDAVGIPNEGPLAGMIVFIQGVVPGDVVDVEIVKRKKRWARGLVSKWIRRSPDRVEVPCDVHARCGGCPWMAGSARAQAKSRLAILRGEARKRLRWDEERLSARVHLADDRGEALAYRCRLRLGYRVSPSGGVRVGFRAPRSHQLVNIERCVVAEKALSDALEPLRRALVERGPGEGEVQLLHGEEGVGAWVKPHAGGGWGFGPQELTVAVGDTRLHLTPDAFAQANRVVTADMIDAIIEAAGPPSGPNAKALELFAGSGTLSVALLRAGYQVHAYELARSSEALFRRNTAGEGRADFHVCDLLETGVPFPTPPSTELVLFDPPRQGALAVMPWLREFGAERMVMVSCDVSTALRDLAELESHYEITHISGWNMFPHTGHQELIARLTRRF